MSKQIQRNTHQNLQPRVEGILHEPSRSPLPSTGYVRLPPILTHIPVGKSTWWKWVAEKKAPQPIKLGPNITAWRAEEIHDFIKQLADNAEA